MKTIFCMLLILWHSTACNQKNHIPMIQKSEDAQRAKHSLDSRIPPPDPRKYKEVRDAKDWQNPYLVVRSEGVEVIAKAASLDWQIISCDELTEFLVSLPVTAWPYGRVIGVQEIGIRRGDGKDDQPIAENKAKVEEVLASLDVKVGRWPS